MKEAAIKKPLLIYSCLSEKFTVYSLSAPPKRGIPIIKGEIMLMSNMVLRNATKELQYVMYSGERGKKGIIVYECSSHSSNINLDPLKFVADSSQMTSSRLMWGL